MQVNTNGVFANLVDRALRHANFAALDLDLHFLEGIGDVDALRDEFLPTARSQRDVTIPPPDLHSYNSLIASGEVY